MILFDGWYMYGDKYFKPNWVSDEGLVMGTTASIKPEDTLGSIVREEETMPMSQLLEVVKHPVGGVGFIVSPEGYGFSLLDLLKDYAQGKRLNREVVSDAVLFHTINNTPDIRFITVEGLNEVLADKTVTVSDYQTSNRLIDAVRIPLENKDTLSRMERRALAINAISDTLILPVMLPVMKLEELLEVYHAKENALSVSVDNTVEDLWKGGINF